MKFLMLPTVVELGWASEEALPMREFQPNVVGPTWEDYYAEMKKQYPVRYFLNVTLVDFMEHRFVDPIQRVCTRLHSRFIEKDHLLDMRQVTWVKDCDEYDWGWIPAREKILYSCMNSLEEFVQGHHAKHHLEWLERAAADSDHDDLQSQIDTYREALEINRWWNVDRKCEFTQLTLKERAATTLEQKAIVWYEWDIFELREDEMLQRLMKIRRNLWQ